MKQSEINKYVHYILEKFKGQRPGNILRELAITDGLRKDFPLTYLNAIKIYIMLLYNGYLEQKSTNMIALTQEGYECISSGNVPCLRISLEALVLSSKDRDSLFYDVWEVIGETDKDDPNPFYVKGSTYYKAIRTGIEGLPPTYTKYVETLPLKIGRAHV